MKNMRKIIMTAAAVMTMGIAAFAVNASAEELTTTESFGVIEETPEGNLIGSDFLTEEELEEISGSESEDTLMTFEIPQIENATEYRAVVDTEKVVDSTDHEDVVVEETTEDEVSDTTDVVEDTDSSKIFADFTDDYMDEEPVVKGDVIENDTVDSTDHEDVVVDETTEEVSDATDVTEDTDFFVDFTDDYMDEEPVVKGDVIEDDTVDSTDHEDVVVEETKKDNNFFVDFTDDYVEPEEKGDILPEPTPEPEPEPTPEPEVPEVPVIPDVPEIIEPEPEPVIPEVPEITEPETEVPVEPTPIYTPVKTSVVDEFVPQVLGDSLFEAPKTGDTFTFTLLSVMAGMILSFGLLVVVNKRRRM